MMFNMHNNNNNKKKKNKKQETTTPHHTNPALKSSPTQRDWDPSSEICA